MREIILYGIAGGLWYDSYACWAEENEESFSGCEITEVCPEPNEQAKKLAEEFLTVLEKKNGASVEELFARAWLVIIWPCKRWGMV